MRPFRVADPEGALVPLEGGAGLLEHLRDPHESEHDLVEGYERAAVQHLDGYSGVLGRCILKQQWAMPFAPSENAIFLPFPDCREFEVQRRDSEGTLTAVEGVEIDVRRDCVVMSDLPSDRSNLHLTCWAGWESAEVVPEPIKQAVRMLVAHWMLHREAGSSDAAVRDVPMGFQMMINPFKHCAV